VVGTNSKKLAVASVEKIIGTCSSMLVKEFRNRVVVVHWYPIMSIDFHEHAMVGMIILRQVYSLIFGPFNVRKHFQGLDRLGKWMSENLEGE